jgi:glutamate/tyrosine decarboxylase-like PLP-dependent enzyme
VTKSPLDLDFQTMQRLGHEVADIIAGHLATVRSQPVTGWQGRRELNAALMRPAPQEPTSFDSIVATLREHVFPYHAREPHPGFMAYIPSSPTFPSLLGDWIATGFNFYAGVWPVASGPNEIEMVVLEWFREWLGLPQGSSGLLTTGGSAANLTAIVAARHAALARGADISKLTVYTSAQAHSSVMRAAWVAGILRNNERTVDMDDGFRLRTDDLEKKISSDRELGLIPFAVVASAGTTNTGSVDPIEDIAEVCERESLWLHVDAAYAGFAVLTEEGRKLLGPLDRADSITLDPHKWLFVPFECGCLMLRDPSKLDDAFHIWPEYLKDVAAGEEEVNFADRGVQLTRYSRALKIWVSVNYFGVRAIADTISASMDRARLMQSLIESSPDFEILSPAQFGVVCFRARPSGLDERQADDLNERINSAVVSGGRFLISSTRLDGKFSLRMCTLGFRTTHDDVRELFETIERSFRQLQ